MTTEPTLREKVLSELAEYRDVFTDEDTVNAIADLLSATGAPAYIRVADDLRGVVREDLPPKSEWVSGSTEYYLSGKRVTKEEYDAHSPDGSSRGWLK